VKQQKRKRNIEGGIYRQQPRTFARRHKKKGGDKNREGDWLTSAMHMFPFFFPDFSLALTFALAEIS
jgi:hypothetical protein